MLDRWLIQALKALAIAIPLWLILVLATGEVSWKLAVVGLVIFAALWIVFIAHAPRRYDSPPSPDEHQSWWTGWF